MDSEQNPSSFGTEILQRILLEVIGVAAFMLAWYLIWQARDPTSWIRLKLAEAEDVFEAKRREHSAVLELRQGIDWWETDGPTE